ncbi:MAG: ribosomal protein [Bacteriovoracaceae bacterium]|nr:ribosomal protein [Bacteriovoracaceae bacterium]
MARGQVFHAVGKRKTSIARIYLRSGDGKVTVNERSFDGYFPLHYQPIVKKPLELLGLAGKYDVVASVIGGGISSQASACMHAIAKALTLVADTNRPTLKKARLLTRDSRVVERKKYGHKKARKSFQFSKR